MCALSRLGWRVVFSSRRLHTRFKCDWSSDVCSSDLFYLSNMFVKSSYADFGTLAEVCVARFNEHIGQIERWRDFQLVGFNAMRLRAEALEPELNAAILEIGKEDFLLGNFDLQSLFSEPFNRYYSDEFVLWLRSELTTGKQAAFQRLADLLGPVHTVLEMGLGCVDIFRVVSCFQVSQGDLISQREAVLRGPYSTLASIP